MRLAKAKGLQPLTQRGVIYKGKSMNQLDKAFEAFKANPNAENAWKLNQLMVWYAGQKNEELERENFLEERWKSEENDTPP
jgi:hypothetical protein